MCPPYAPVCSVLVPSDLPPLWFGGCLRLDVPFAVLLISLVVAASPSSDVDQHLSLQPALSPPLEMGAEVREEAVLAPAAFLAQEAAERSVAAAVVVVSDDF